MVLPVLPSLANISVADEHPYDTAENLQQGLLTQYLANQHANQANQMQPQMLQEQLKNLQARTGLTGAQTKQLPLDAQARLLAAQRGLHQNTQVVQTPKGYVRIDKTTGRSIPITDTQGNPVMPVQRQGLSISQTPGGGFTVTQGGIMPSGTNAQGTTGAVRLLGGNNRSTSGATYMNPNTGDAASIPTSKLASMLQQSLTGETIGDPSLRRIYQEIAPVLGGGGMVSRLTSPIARMLGVNTPQYDAYQSATQSGIPQVADQLLKTYGLTAGEGNRLSIVHALQPNATDTAQSYRKRMGDTIAGMMYRSGAYKKYLKGGIPLQDDPREGGEMLSALSNKIQNELQNPRAPGKLIPTPASTPTAQVLTPIQKSARAEQQRRAALIKANRGS